MSSKGSDPSVYVLLYMFASHHLPPRQFRREPTSLLSFFHSRFYMLYTFYTANPTTASLSVYPVSCAFGDWVTHNLITSSISFLLSDKPHADSTNMPPFPPRRDFTPPCTQYFTSNTISAISLHIPIVHLCPKPQDGIVHYINCQFPQSIVIYFVWRQIKPKIRYYHIL